MKEETFNLVVDKLQKTHASEKQLCSLGVSVMELTDKYHTAITALLMESFSTDKIDTLNWYLHEYRKGKMKIINSKTKKVMFDFDKTGDLWEYMCSK